MWHPDLKSKTDEFNFIGSNLFLILLSIFLLFGNGITIKNKAIAVLRIALSSVSIAVSVKVLKDTSLWLSEDYSELENVKRRARKLISEELITSNTNDSINAIYGETEAVIDSTIESPQLPSGLGSFDWQSLRNSRQYPHISIEDKTGGGKSTLAEYIGSLLGGRFIAIAPHYQSGDFQSASLIVGKGRNYGDEASVLDADLVELHFQFQDVLNGNKPVTVLEFLELVHAEMRYRYNLDNYKDTEHLNIVLDEFNSYSSKKGVKDLFKELIREARKVNIRLIILCQGSEVKALGIEGEGSLRENLTRIRLKTFALVYAKTQFNKYKEHSEDKVYWGKVINGLNNTNWSGLVEDNYAVIPNLSNWSNNNTDQVIYDSISATTTATTYTDKPLYNEDDDVCNHCGSDNVKKHSAGRISCRDCGKTSTKKAKKK